jgi:hypothetical protein
VVIAAGLDTHRMLRLKSDEKMFSGNVDSELSER